MGHKSTSLGVSTDTVSLVTACDDRYAAYALNLLGSLAEQIHYFSEVIVVDLGMSSFYRFAFENISGVKIKKLDRFCPHYRVCWSWKTWAYLVGKGDVVLYLDAGSEVVGDLGNIIDAIKKDGYFIVSQVGTLPNGHYIEDIIPHSYYKEYGLSQSRLKGKSVVAAGILGFQRGGEFYKKVILPMHEEIVKGKNLGWSQEELYRNRGIHFQQNPKIWDCKYFRHDQTILNIMIRKTYTKPIIQPMERYAALVAQPDQIILNKRRENGCDQISKVSYNRRIIIHRILAIYIRVTKRRK